LPLLATRCGGYEELVTHKENGWLVDVGNPKQIADGIKLLSNNTGISKELALKAKQHVVNNYDISVMLKAYEDVYDEVLNR